MIHNRLLSATFAAALAVFASTPAWTMENNAPDPKLDPARALIKNGKWAEAAAELQKVNDTRSADWNNLMGYTARSAGKPDLEASERYYNEALRINPEHRGALEYSGQLYLIKGDLSAAEARLATLDKLCTFGCDEYRSLKRSIERYKTEGNKQAADGTQPQSGYR